MRRIRDLHVEELDNYAKLVEGSVMIDNARQYTSNHSLFEQETLGIPLDKATSHLRGTSRGSRTSHATSASQVRSLKSKSGYQLLNDS